MNRIKQQRQTLLLDIPPPPVEELSSPIRFIADNPNLEESTFLLDTPHLLVVPPVEDPPLTKHFHYR